MQHFRRTQAEKILINAYSQFKSNRIKRGNKYKTLLLTGPKGCGKTTLAINFALKYAHFYFSFAGLDEDMALQLFTKLICEYRGKENITTWNEALTALNQSHLVVIFDDMVSTLSYKYFWDIFNSYYNGKDVNNMFVVMIDDYNNDIPQLKHKKIDSLGWCTIADIMKAKPHLSNKDILRLYAVSGGIPDIINSYNENESFEENILAFLKPETPFYKTSTNLLSGYFRRTEVYEHILYAIAMKKHRISEIAEFTGFACNKCDKYIKAMIEHQLVIAYQELDENTKVKTYYRIVGGYFKLWYRYIYLNKAQIITGQTDCLLMDRVIPHIDKTLVDEEYRQACLRFLPQKIRNIDYMFKYFKPTDMRTETVRKAKFQYQFDAIIRYEGKAVFIKILIDENSNCPKEELDKTEKAITIAHRYYDSHVIIFSKKRFSDYAVSLAARDETIALVVIERLKY